MDTAIHHPVLDNVTICLEVLDGKALCRECTIDPEGSIPEADFKSFSSSDPEEFSAHLLKHIAVRHEIPSEQLTVEYWSALLVGPQRP